MSKTYYWLNMTDLEPGSVVNPGGWGNFNYRKPLRNLDPWIIMREYILENIRRIHYPDRISRMNCIFLFDSFMESRQAAASWRRELDFTYRVEPVKEDARIFVSDYKFSGISMDSSIIDLEYAAHNYWKAAECTHKEYLLEGGIRILEKK